MHASRVSCFALIILSCACNKPPGAPAVNIEPTEPGTSDNLEAVLTSPSVDDNAKDTISYTYAWFQDGQERSDMREANIPATLTSKGEVWEVVVTPSDGKIDGESASAETTIVNTAPSAEVELSPAAPTADQALEATAVGTDVDDDNVTFAYTWTVDGVESSHAGDTVPAIDTVRGQLWEVTVVPNDGEDLGEAVSASVSIENTAPEITSAELGPEPAYETTTLEVSWEATDLDDDEVQASYAFYVNGTLAQDSDLATLDGSLFDKGQQVQAVVTPSDDFLSGEGFATNTVEILNSAPSYDAVALDPSEIYEDTTVSCLPTGWSDADGDAESYTIQWYVEDAAVSTDATIDGTLFDRGDELYCEVTPHDGEEAGAPVTSDVATVGNSPPSIASASLSTTSPTETDTISVTVTDAVDADDDSITLSYAWSVNGVVVSSLPSLSGDYFDKGDTIVAQVSPNDGRDTGTPVTSDTATAINSAPVISGITLSPSSLYTDDSLVAAVADTDADGDTVTLSYTWYIDSVAVSAAGNTLSGSTWFDRGQQIYVVVTPNDGTVDGSTVTSSTVTVINSPPSAPTVGITPAEPEPGVDDLLCEVLVDSTDDDGDSFTYGFSWLLDGAAWTGIQIDTASSSLIPSLETGDNETWTCAATPDDGYDAGTAGTASVDLGEGMEVCTWPDEDLWVSSGPVSGPTISPYYFTVSFIATIESDVFYDWMNSSGDQPAYIEFEFYDSSATSLCSIYYDMDAATVATGWTTSSGGTLYGAWEVPLTGGYTTCQPVSSATWGTNDLRDVLELHTWGVGVGALVDLMATLPTAVIDSGLDWTADWAPYVSAEYVYSDIYGQAYELGWSWGWEHDCGELSTDASGDGIKLSTPTSSPLDNAVWDGNGYLLFYASAL